MPSESASRHGAASGAVQQHAHARQHLWGFALPRGPLPHLRTLHARVDEGVLAVVRRVLAGVEDALLGGDVGPTSAQVDDAQQLQAWPGSGVTGGEPGARRAPADQPASEAAPQEAAQEAPRRWGWGSTGVAQAARPVALRAAARRAQARQQPRRVRRPAQTWPHPGRAAWPPGRPGGRTETSNPLAISCRSGTKGADR